MVGIFCVPVEIWFYSGNRNIMSTFSEWIWCIKSPEVALENTRRTSQWTMKHHSVHFNIFAYTTNRYSHRKQPMKVKGRGIPPIVTVCFSFPSWSVNLTIVWIYLIKYRACPFCQLLEQHIQWREVITIGVGRNVKAPLIHIFLSIKIFVANTKFSNGHNDTSKHEFAGSSQRYYYYTTYYT